MRMRETDGPADPRVERDLETVDRALAGEPVELGGGDLAAFALLLREERPQSEARWAAGLDDRAAAGFPRGGDSFSRRLPDLLGGGRWMAPAGALATLAIVVGVVASTGGGGETRRDGDSAALSGETAEMSAESPESTTSTKYQAAETTDQGEALRTFDRSAALQAGKIAPGTENRKVDRSTQLSLSAQPEDVREVSDEVIAITRLLDGIVASSQVSETDGDATATLALTLPTRNLDAAVDRMTELATVDSLNELTEDITKPFVSAQDRVRDAEARRRELLEALGNATTETEVEALTLQLADARREISKAEAAFDRVASRARLSDLNVTVSSDPNAADERTLGDWLDDALDVLRAVAGVLLVAAAVVIPLGAIAAAAIWIGLRLRRRRRERALDA